MNILVLANEYPYDKFPRKNWTKTVNYFARAWVKQGHQVVVIVNATRFPSVYYRVASFLKSIIASKYDIDSSDVDNSSWTKPFGFEDEGVLVFNMPMLKRRPGGKFSKSEFRRQEHKIVAQLKKIGFTPDAITGHWLNPQLELIVRLKSHYQAKTAFVFHIDYQEENCRKFNAIGNAPRLDHIGCRCLADAKKIMGWLPLKEHPFLCPSGVPDEYVEEAISNNSPKTFGKVPLKILTCGRMVQYKQFPAVIEAASKSFGRYELNIIGDGPLRCELESFAASIGQAGNVHFLGRIPRDKVQKMMSESEIFALVSIQETFGMVYLEAMLQGCIVVASKDGGVDGIIIDGENGFLCEEGNAEELTQVLKKIQSLSTEEKISISQNAIKTAKEYSDSKVAARYLENVIK